MFNSGLTVLTKPRQFSSSSLVIIINNNIFYREKALEVGFFSYMTSTTHL